MTGQPEYNKIPLIPAYKPSSVIRTVYQGRKQGAADTRISGIHSPEVQEGIITDP